MKRLLTAALSVVLVLGSAPSLLIGQAPQEDIRSLLEANAVIRPKVMVPMRDGVRMAADVYVPKGDGPFPVIFSRTPYNFNAWRDGEFSAGAYRGAWNAVSRGYAYVVMNERGRFFSEGNWDILGTPLTDGYDAFEWMAAQPWSNGKIGTLGCSSTAEWQMAVASLDHPAHTTLVAQGFGAGVGRIGDWYEQGNWYRGGAEQMLFFAWLYGVQTGIRPMFPPNLTQEQLAQVSRYFDLAPEMPRVDWAEGLKHLPLVDILKNAEGNTGPYEDMVKRKPNDPKWYQGGLYHDDMPFDKPAIWFMSWYDVSTGPNLALFNHVMNNAETAEARANQYAVIAPTLHCAYTRATENTVVGERSVGDARWDYDALVYGWFDTFLKGEDNGLLDTLPKVRYYTMGSNEWKTSDSWPPKTATPVTYYLDSGGNANTLHGDGRLTTRMPSADNPDRFAYDPMDPVMSHGGNVCCTGNAVTGGALDQRQMEERDDILVYTSDVFENGVEVTGTIDITLFVSSDARDTDFTVKLIDVYPDGTAYNLDETIQRARYRDGYDKEVFMEAGATYEIKLSPLSTSNFFAPGHRIRIEVSSSNFPRFTRNMNTGGDGWNETEGVVAHNVIHHSRQHPSRIRLPIVRRPAS
ncbi:MAG TPA: CocE/NonD family hydrolase [Longimicrobiales bacterium]|nr:CocE/NonD family hydrolase [Longimicrobiales bacterium]